MAHQLLDDTMFYVGETPWHKLGIKLEKPPTIEDALVQGNLDWSVIKVPTDAISKANHCNSTNHHS